ncbi:Ydr279p protein family-domain-containing protein [Cokeromyces recurvatus]|uniref:Ydr279p protein family-domain-containing protein n=1 Tax=Cokeromyces recurvatus TaxID=90255 RepID=UPI00221E7B06|nr:Ydr279p protein family-domain-containing protein [Cokeromyces recurvatus]KAI7903285.1 Ydr279p protein family-domain-containing protein [Cokeromyces recurvatus]
MKTQIIAFTNKSDQDVNNLTELYLPCPRSNRRSVYFQNSKGQLYEIQKVTLGRKSSWLLDNHIYKDGAVRFITPLDPLFMALPILQQAFEKDKEKFQTLDTIFSRENVQLETIGLEDSSSTAEETIDVHRLTSLTGFSEQLSHLCDTQEIAPDLFIYKFNQELALNWLTKKVEQLILNTTFKKQFNTTQQDQDVIKLEAVYTLSNYLNRFWFEKLLTKLNLKEIIKEEDVVGNITNYVIDASPSAYFKRVHPDEKFVDEPKVSYIYNSCHVKYICI